LKPGFGTKPLKDSLGEYNLSGSKSSSTGSPDVLPLHMFHMVLSLTHQDDVIVISHVRRRGILMNKSGFREFEKPWELGNSLAEFGKFLKP
jgi:hypothetical protein